MNTISFDPAGGLNLVFRKNTIEGKTFTFTDSNGDPYTLSGQDFELRFKKKSGYTSNVLLLTSSSGLVITNNQIQIGLTANQTNQSVDFCYYELYNVSSSEVWICGNAYFITGSPEPTDDISVTINLALETVTFVIENTSGGSPYRGAFIASDDVFPSSGGSGSGGAIIDGDEWRTTVSASYGGLLFPASTILKAIGNAPGQSLSNWRLI